MKQRDCYKKLHGSPPHSFPSSGHMPQSNNYEQENFLPDVLYPRCFLPSFLHHHNSRQIATLGSFCSISLWWLATSCCRYPLRQPGAIACPFFAAEYVVHWRRRGIYKYTASKAGGCESSSCYCRPTAAAAAERHHRRRLANVLLSIS